MAKFMYYFLFVFWQFQNQLKLLSNFLDKQLIYMEIKWKRKCIIGQGQAHNKCSCVMNMHESQLSSCTNLHVKIIKVKKVLMNELMKREKVGHENKVLTNLENLINLKFSGRN